MPVALARLPRYLILEPVASVRLEIELAQPACEIDVELDNPSTGRSFLLALGKKGGPQLQRMRLTGRARVLFDPRAPGVYVLVLTNPQKEPLVLKLRAKHVARPASARRPRARTRRTPPTVTRRRNVANQSSSPRSLRPAVRRAPRPKE